MKFSEVLRAGCAGIDDRPGPHARALALSPDPQLLLAAMRLPADDALLRMGVNM